MNEDYNTPWWVTVGFVCGIVIFDYFIFMTRFAYYWIQINPGLCLAIVGPFQLLMIMLAWSYYKAVREPPGFIESSVNDSFSESDLERLKSYAKQEQSIKKEIRKKKIKPKPQNMELQNRFNSHGTQDTIDNGENLTVENFDIIQSMSKTSYCFKCNQVKPPRAHHCKECRRCILRMDHHCPWVGNCVGQQNHKYFILFLLYATLTGTFVCSVIGIDYLLGARVRNMNQKHNDQLLLTICGSTCLALAACIGFLFVFQVMGMFKNITTVEHHVDEMHTRNPFRKHNKISNMIDIFGTNKKQWLFPVKPSQYGRSDLFSYGRFENELKV